MRRKKKSLSNPQFLLSSKWLLFACCFIFVIIVITYNSGELFAQQKVRRIPVNTSSSEMIKIISADNGATDNKQLYLQKAKIDLAEKTGKPVEEIQVKQIIEKRWSDTSLGCPKRGIFYAQVLVPGYLITLQLDSQEYLYHAGSGKVISCQR